MILVTGGLGFIGSHVCKALLERGERVIATYHTNRTVPQFLKNHAGQCTIEELDVANKSQFEALVQKYQCTQIIHLAASKIGSIEIIDDLSTNIQGFLNALSIAHAHNVSRVVVTSSIGVYSNSPLPLAEDASLSMSGANPIAANKKIFEIVGDAVATHSDIEVAFARPSAIWGPLGRPRSVFFSLPQMVNAAAQGSVPEGLGLIYAEDGIDMLYAKDCGKAIAMLATAPKLEHRTYNVGEGRATTNKEIAAALQELAPSVHFQLQTGHAPGAPSQNFFMDVTRLKSLGFEPDYDLKQGLTDYMDWRSINEQ